MNLKHFIKILTYSNIGSLFSFLYLITLSNFLSLNDFSLVTSLSNLAVGIAYIFSFFVPLLSNEISINKDFNFYLFYKNFFSKVLILLLTTILLSLIFKNQLYNFFNFSNYKLIILTLLILFINIIIYIQIGIIYGKLAVKFQSKIQCFQQIFRLMLLLILLYFIYKDYFPLLSTLLAMLFTSLCFHIYINNEFIKEKKNLKNNYKKEINIKKFNIPKSIIFCLVCSILIYSDIILSRFIFLPDNAAELNMMSSLSKINFYFISSLIPAIIPAANKFGNNMHLKYIKKIYFIIISLAILTNFFYYLIGDYFISYVFKINLNNGIINMIKMNSAFIIFSGLICFLNSYYNDFNLKKGALMILILSTFVFYLSKQLTLDSFCNFMFFGSILIFFIFLLIINKRLVFFSQTPN